uniref:Btz domain-containing protein n=1 Tax=Angiostrongylus cantonensis TaxID=6313 RepID=A0A0K0D3F9_ANGCA
MGKRRYLNLSGGPFREGDEPKNKQNKKEESIGRKNEDDPTNEEEQEEEEVEIEQRELSQCAERKELGPCETPRRKFVKRKHRKFDSGIPFRCNSQFGGFSRTNAAPHYQYERGKGTERYRTRRPNEPNEVLKVIWLDKSVPLPNAQHGRRSPEEDNSGAEENGIFEGGCE